MSTEAEQYNTLRTWLMALTGLPEIILANPNAPRPQGSYGMLNLIRMTRINWPDAYEYEVDEEGSTAETIFQTPIEHWRCTWSFNVYAPNAASIASLVKTADGSHAALRTLEPYTIFSTSDIRRLPELIQQTWEDRAQIDIELDAKLKRRFEIDVVETVTINAEIIDGTATGSKTVTKPDNT